MKKLVYFTILLAIFSCNKNSSASVEFPEDKTTTLSKSTQNSAELADELQTIDDIKVEYSSITNKIELKSMDSVSFKYSCNNEKSGKVVYFLENGNVRKIRHTYSEYSHFSATDDYFVKDGNVFFVLKNHVVWSFVDQDQTKDDITEMRFYVINNKPIKCTQNKSTIVSRSGNKGKPTNVSSKELECPSLAPILKEFNKLFKLSKQRKDLKCLDE